MPEISIVIPVFNEEDLVVHEITALLAALESSGSEYEIILVENGSTDRTARLVDDLSAVRRAVRVTHLPEADYGRALRTGILQSAGRHIVVFNIDYWDFDWLQAALQRLRAGEADLVIGSKTMAGAEDRRSFGRRFVTRGFNVLLKILFGFRGTDTHGLKAFQREIIIPIVRECRTDGLIFDTELVLRAERAGKKVTEIPVVCVEKRATRLNIRKSVIHTLRDLRILYAALK